MADQSLTLLSLINQQVEDQELLSEYLLKAEALTQIALVEDFLEQPAKILYYYLWALNDIVERARVMNEQSLSVLMKKMPLPTFET